MDLKLNNLQWLICQKNKPNQYKRGRLILFMKKSYKSLPNVPSVTYVIFIINDI